VLGFLPGFLLLVIFAKSKGLSLERIFIISLSGVRKTSGVIWILFLVGFLLPSWYLSGTIDQMVSIALHVITLDHYFTLSFIITFIFSMILGTSVGTLSAIGIPIIGSAMSLHLPTEIVAGALISGAFVGDRTSPFSSAHQLLANTIEISIRAQFRAMLPTSIIAVLIGMAFYSYLDYQLVDSTLKVELNSLGHLSILKFLPPAILILMVIFRYKIFFGFIFSIGVACILSITDGVSLMNLVSSLFFGIEGLGGGFINMYSLLLFLGIAGAYNGLLEELKILQPFLDRWLQSSHSLLSDTCKTMLATLGITLIAANQTLPIIMTGRSFLSHWSTKHSKEQLSRVMGDTTMLFPGMIPWSVLTIMCSTVVGISVFDYFKYSVFLWILPLLTIIVSIVGGYKKKKFITSSVK
jgi:Na+:H+ antiporter, NhaC family